MGDFDRLLAEQLQDPEFRASYEDIQNRTGTCIDLIRRREASGVTPGEVADFLIKAIGMPTKRARRWVKEFETGQLFHNAPMWLMHAYARSVGMRVRMVIEPRHAADDGGAQPGTVSGGEQA